MARDVSRCDRIGLWRPRLPTAAEVEHASRVGEPLCLLVYAGPLAGGPAPWVVIPAEHLVRVVLVVEAGRVVVLREDGVALSRFGAGVRVWGRFEGAPASEPYGRAEVSRCRR